jgi:pimeloyl-ACP methyl ester carboxylesterase
MHYRRIGEGSPIVLLHGWPQTGYAWRHVADDLAADQHSGAVYDKVGKVFVWRFANPLGAAPWPTFRQGLTRLGRG